MLGFARNFYPVVASFLSEAAAAALCGGSSSRPR
jgi:hypothetical protein